MGKSVVVISKMNCNYLVKQLCNDKNKNFCDLYQDIVNEIGEIEAYKKMYGEDIYLKKEKEFLVDLLTKKDTISFLSYDIFKHNIDINMYRDVYLVMLDFGYFIRSGNDIIRMQQSTRYLKAKSVCDEIIDCRNMSGDRILKKLKECSNGK